jgi:hypothetical protein
MDRVKPKEEIPPEILKWAKSMRETFGDVKLYKGLPWFPPIKRGR